MALGTFSGDSPDLHTSPNPALGLALFAARLSQRTTSVWVPNNGTSCGLLRAGGLVARSAACNKKSKSVWYPCNGIYNICPNTKAPSAAQLAAMLLLACTLVLLMSRISADEADVTKQLAACTQKNTDQARHVEACKTQLGIAKEERKSMHQSFSQLKVRTWRQLLCRSCAGPSAIFSAPCLAILRQLSIVLAAANSYAQRVNKNISPR